MPTPRSVARPALADLAAARDTTIPDVIAPGLAVLFAGINPGLYSAATGYHFARPGNRFWPALHRSGFTPRLFRPEEQEQLLGLGLGITNIVARATARAGELRPEEFTDGARVLTGKVQQLRPAWLAVLGVTAYRQAFGQPRTAVGRQEETIGPARIWVLPNPSSLNAHWTADSLAAEFARLRSSAVGEASHRPAVYARPRLDKRQLCGSPWLRQPRARRHGNRLAARRQREGDTAVAAETEFTIGAQAYCSDGFCGEVMRIIFDPAAGTVTHLAIEPKNQPENGRLVPIEMAESVDGGVRLRCSLAEFHGLDPSEDIEIVQGYTYQGGYGPAEAVEGYGDVGSMGVGGSGTGMGVPMGIPHRLKTVTDAVVPVGEAEASQGDRVYATDGEIGRVHGFLINPDDHRATHVVLEHGHLWGRKEVAIPMSAVKEVDAGVRLNISKQEVEELPPIG